jgi:hypothetical protein
MKLIFSPVRMDATLTASVAGDVLTLNGVVLDFGPLPLGATLPRAAIPCDWIAGDVTRDDDGTLTIPLILPHGPDAPPETLFPAPVDASYGDVKLPPYSKPRHEIMASADGESWKDSYVMENTDED